MLPIYRTPGREQPIDTVITKGPYLTMYFPELHPLLPDARFVLIARDPRDTIASMVDVGERLKSKGQAHFFQNRDMKKLSNHMKSFYAPSLDSSDQAVRKALMTVKYEDLVADTDAFIRVARDTVALNLHNDIAEKEEESRSNYGAWRTGPAYRNPNADPVGRYEKVLSAREITEIEMACGDFMSGFGY